MTSRSPATPFACTTHGSMPSVTKCTRASRLYAGAVWVGPKIGTPVVDEVAGPPPGDDGAGRQHLVEHDLALGITRPKVSDLGPSVAEPLLQPHAANSSRVPFVVTRTGDESVQGHRHIQDQTRHDSSKGFGSDGLRELEQSVGVVGLLGRCQDR